VPDFPGAAAPSEPAEEARLQARVRGEALWYYRMLEPHTWYAASPVAGDAGSLGLHTPTGIRIVRREHFLVRERGA
jgi:hypothetical protein